MKRVDFSIAYLEEVTRKKRFAGYIVKLIVFSQLVRASGNEDKLEMDKLIILS